MRRIINIFASVLLCALLFCTACGDEPAQTPDSGQSGTQQGAGSPVTPPDQPSGGEGDGQTAPEPKYFTVTLDWKNGQDPTVRQVKEGDTLSKPEDPKRDGHEFAGWTAGGTVYDFTAPITDDITVTAEWTELTAIAPEVDEMPTGLKISETFGGVLKLTVKEQSGYTYVYEWYIDTDGDGIGGSFFGATDNGAVSLPTDREEGSEYYVYCVITGTDNMTGLSARTTSSAAAVHIISSAAADTPDVPDTPIPEPLPDVEIVPDSTAPVVCTDGVMDAFIFGGQMMGSYNMAQTLKTMIEKGQDITVSFTNAYLTHTNQYTTYNLWEMFAKDARGSISDYTFASGNTPQKLKKLLETTALDCLILQTGRDLSIDNANYREYNTFSACKIAKLAHDRNPNVKILLVAPYGHQQTWGDFGKSKISDHATHVKYINAEAESIKNAIINGGYAENVEVISIGSLFESISDNPQTVKSQLFRPDDGAAGKENTGNRANARGSYLAAAGIYAAMFDCSPVGVRHFGTNTSSVNSTVSKTTALNMQKAAAEYVLGVTSDATVEVFFGDEYYSKGAQAIIAAADAYVDRGSWVQYDDTRLVKRSSNMQAVYRHRRGVQPPELATSQNTIYTNCAAFMNTLIREAFDYDIVSWYTGDFIERKDMTVFYYDVVGNETQEFRDNTIRQIEALLMPGDMIVYRLPDESNGHIIMYIGDGIYVHSTGSNYNYSSGEVFEKNGSIRYDELSKTVFDSSTNRYLFKMGRFAVLRPISIIDKPVPQKTLDRMFYMEDITAQKLTSHPQGKSVNPGDTVSYTVNVENKGSEDAQIEIRSTLAPKTTYVSGDGTLSGNTVTWTATVAAGEIYEASYAVRVSGDVGMGDTISHGTTSVNGISLYCADIYAANTLTQDQQTRIDQAARAHEGSKSTMSQIINSVYTTVMGDNIGLTNEKALFAKLFTSIGYGDYLNINSSPMVVPTLYGGYYVDNSTFHRDRIQLLRPSMVMTGDIIFVSPTSDGKDSAMYFVLDGSSLLYMTSSGAKIMEAEKATSMMSSILGKNAFCVLRPSFIF